MLQPSATADQVQLLLAVSRTQRALDFAVGVTLGDDLALVVLTAAARHSQLDLGEAILEVQAQRDDGQAFLLDLTRQILDLRSMQQQTARTPRLVSELCRRAVLGDMGSLEPDLAVLGSCV